MKTVFFDVDTQIDFLSPAGALYVPGAEHLVPQVAALNRWAAAHGIVVVSDVDAHAEDDPEFADWPPHCVAGTTGQQKPASTLLEKRVTVINNSGLPPIEGFQQIVHEKQSLDCFSCLNMPELLVRLNADRYVVYGVVTEICVKYAAFGLLKAGKRVELVTDAIKELDSAAAEKTFVEFTAAGGVLTTCAQVMAA